MNLVAFRSSVLAAVRRFFLARGFVEVETPVCIPAPAPEPHLDLVPCAGGYLRPSPELALKRLLAAGHPRLFELGPCFRAGERGDRHHPEFTLLEWYRADAHYRDVLEDTRALLPFVARETLGTDTVRRADQIIHLAAPWQERTVAEVFRAQAGWDPTADFDADRFDLDLLEKVEPALPGDRPCVLFDYPADRAALARCRRETDGRRVAERWELYAGGMELANAYSELADETEMRARFSEWNAARRAAGKPVLPLDEPFLASLRRMPPAGGVALGFDRLVMLLSGAPTISAVRALSDSDSPGLGC